MYAFEMINISKNFGKVKANDNVNFKVKKGEIRALVGENGAGKSTLMKILYGMYYPYQGKILINNNEYIMKNSSNAIKLGIGMVHQHFMLIPPLTVTENIILGNEPTKGLTAIDFKKAELQIKELSEKFNIYIDPNAKIENLSVGFEQRVEILKILYRNADILILDEPTAVLTPQEVDDLFSTLRSLKKKGKTIIIITHKLNEIMEISDTITIMNHGKIVFNDDTSKTTKEDLARKMVGKDLSKEINKSDLNYKETTLEVKNLCANNDKKIPVLKNVSFSIRKGEILGIAGVEGNGQTELIEVITDLRMKTSGTIDFHGKVKAHIPEDRLKRGIVSDFSISENILLGRQNENKFLSGLFINQAELSEFTDELIKNFDIRPPDQTLFAKKLSGGNQQKLVVARELTKHAELIIVAHPSRGLDILATDFIHNSILNERNKGNAVLLISSDLTELLKLSDRIAIMFEGKISKILKSSEVTERDLGIYMTGVLS